MQFFLRSSMNFIQNNGNEAILIARGAVREGGEANEATPLVTRAFEITVSVVLLLVTSPIMLAIALIIKWGTPGPAVFKQTRVGRNRKPFTLYKFRTLYADARERFPELYRYNYSPDQIKTLQFKTEDDPRVTPQGKWLRSSTLDELPNLWNVVKGDMALVGPRPEIPEMLPYYTGELAEKFTVRPGVTGLAQISGRGRLKFLETAGYDLQYVRNRGPMLDLKILLLTVRKILLRDGAF
jgi:lipopolysaccharide/colanic/teichoic acid biosynthesis glycosyltransferase